MGIKKQPMRMCVACRNMREKNKLMRLVKTSDETVVFDESGKAAGRGAYICRCRECVERAKKTRAIDRALGVKPDWDALEEAIGVYDDEQQ